MKRKHKRDPARALWMLSGLTIVLTYALAVRPIETALADTAAQTEALDRRARSEEAALRTFGALRREQPSIDRNLQGVDLARSRGAATAALLAGLAANAASRHVELTGVQPRGTGSQSASRRSVKSGPPLELVDVTVRGRYPDVIQFIRSSSLTSTPARVGRVALERGHAGSGTIEATITLETIGAGFGDDGA